MLVQLVFRKLLLILQLFMHLVRGIIICYQLKNNWHQYFIAMHYMSLEVKGWWGLLLPSSLLINANKHFPVPPSWLRHSSVGAIWIRSRAYFTDRSPCPLESSNTEFAPLYINFLCLFPNNKIPFKFVPEEYSQLIDKWLVTPCSTCLYLVQ